MNRIEASGKASWSPILQAETRVKREQHLDGPVRGECKTDESVSIQTGLRSSAARKWMLRGGTRSRVDHSELCFRRGNRTHVYFEDITKCLSQFQSGTLYPEPDKHELRVLPDRMILD